MRNDALTLKMKKMKDFTYKIGAQKNWERETDPLHECMLTGVAYRGATDADVC
jgi:hypothetical protein